mgnify:CR=1 FL=1
MARLDEFCLINMGQSPDSSTYNEAKNGLPFFQGNADFGELYPMVRMWCTEPTKIAQKEDILISVRAPIGALNVANCKCCIGRGLAALRVNEDKCVQKYLWYALSNKVDELNSKGTGSTFKAINKKILAETEIPLPPLAEQRKIAAVLDKVSDLIAKRRQQLTKLDELVKARFMEMFGKLEFNNNATTIEEISEMVTVGIANSATHAYAAEGIVLLRNQNIRENYLDDSDLVYITPAFADKYRTKALKENDILVTRTGYPGIACLVPKKYIGCQTFTTLILRLKESIAILPSFVCHYINSNYGKSFVEEMKVGVAQQNFGAKALGKMPIFVPPIEKQVEFVTFIDEIEKIKVSTSHSLDKLETLKNALMQEYFG